MKYIQNQLLKNYTNKQNFKSYNIHDILSWYIILIKVIQTLISTYYKFQQLPIPNILALGQVTKTEKKSP